jgi:lipopolysaccharide biosynthesis glycosyltransferase
MRFVFCGDSGVAEPIAVTIRTLVAASHDTAQLRVTVLVSGWTERQEALAQRAAAPVAVDLIDVSRLDLPAMHGGAFLPPAAYLRFAIPRLIDEGRAIYLDGDVLVRRDLTELWRHDLQGLSTGACRAGSTPFLGSPGAVEGWRELGLDPTAPALNSGVLLMDLDDWRRQRLAERAFELAMKRGTQFRLADQAVLNVVLNGAWVPLHPRWNATSGVFQDDKGLCAVEDPLRIQEAAEDPAIVHFTGSRKPWRHFVNRPFSEEWRAAGRELGWAPWLDPPPLRVRASRAKSRVQRFVGR